MDEFYSHYVYNGARGRRVQDGFRRRVCRGCRNRPGHHRGWADQELALSRLADQLDARAEGGDRSHRQRRLVSGWRRQPSVSKHRGATCSNPQLAMQETAAIQKHFGKKRDYVLVRLKHMGIGVDAEPAGAFYVWANLSATAETAERRHEFLPRRPEGKGHHRPRRFLRRESRQPARPWPLRPITAASASARK